MLLLLPMINHLISETSIAVGELSDEGMKCIVSDERSICSSSSLGSPVLKMDIVDVEPNAMTYRTKWLQVEEHSMSAIAFSPRLALNPMFDHRCIQSKNNEA